MDENLFNAFIPDLIMLIKKNDSFLATRVFDNIPDSQYEDICSGGFSECI